MKDIDTYLIGLSSYLKIDSHKKEKIEISIAFLKKGIWGHFQNRLTEVETIGSFDRDTIIMQDIDADVDLIVVFKQKELQPETYLKQLKDFCIRSYPRSAIYQDHPTIVIDMDHIRFEIVPSYFVSETYKKIPAPKSAEFQWIDTDPRYFKEKVDVKDINNKGIIKQIIRILKYWNNLNEKPFSSYEIEKIIISKTYFCSTLRDYFFSAINAIIESAITENQIDKCNGLKERKRRLKILEEEKIIDYIESEFQSFLPFT